MKNDSSPSNLIVLKNNYSKCHDNNFFDYFNFLLPLSFINKVVRVG